MFNLFRSRDKAVRILLGGMLVLVSLSMLTYLIPNYNTGSSASDVIVAEIGKDTITLPDVQKGIQMAIRGRQLPAEIIPHYVPQLIENMITERVMVYQAKRMGFHVSENDIVVGIRSYLPNLFPDGKFAGKDTYGAMLAQQNMTIPEFESNMERQLLITRLRQVVLEGTVVPPQDIEREYRQKNDKVKVEYVRIASDKFRSEVRITPEEMQKYYQDNRASFTINEKRSLGILVISQAKLEESVHPTDADLEKVYNREKDRFRLPERVKARHILLTTTGKSKDEEVAIKAKADNLLKQVKSGGDFAKLAKENSQDPGSAQNGGELGWLVRGQTVPEFEKTAFSLQPNQISDLVKTQYGYHIIQVETKEQARLKPFAEVKAELASEYKTQQVGQQMQTLTDKVQAALRKDPLHPDKVAADNGVEFARVENVSAGDPLPLVGVNKEFEESLSSLKAGEVSQPVMLPANRVVIASITGVAPAHPATFEEAQNQIREALDKDKLAKVNTQKAQELLDKARSMGGDLQKAAKAMGLEWKASSEVTRFGAVEGLGSASSIADAFTQPVGSLFGPVTMLDAKVVVKVVARVNADMAGLPAQRDAIREELKSKKAQERERLFEEGLRQSLIREGKIKIHQDVINRLTATYRG